MINLRIEHTNLKSNATKDDIVKLCNEATQNNFRSVVVNQNYVRLAKSLLQNSKIKVVSVVDFPIGASSTLTRILQAKDAANDGADEIDIPINVAALKSGEFDLTKKDLQDIILSVKKPVKVIVEVSLLTDEELKKACEIVMQSGAAYIKTHTGTTGTVKREDVEKIRDIVRTSINVKASGGIKNFDDAMKMFDAGADLIGTSNSLNIIKDAIPITYLSGAIYGISKEEASSWRKELIKEFGDTVYCLDPLRKPYETLEERYSEYWKDIVEADKKDIDISDFIILKFEKPSVGTMMEFMYAFERNKPIYFWTERTRWSPWVTAHATKIISTKKELVDVVKELHLK